MLSNHLLRLNNCAARVVLQRRLNTQVWNQRPPKALRWPRRPCDSSFPLHGSQSYYDHFRCLRAHGVQHQLFSAASKVEDTPNKEEAGGGGSSSDPGGDQGKPHAQLVAFKKQAVRVGTVASIGLAAYMVSTGAYDFVHKLLTISPLTFLHIGFATGALLMSGAGLVVFRYKASTFVRPEKLYFKAVHALEGNAKIAAKIGPETLHRADQVRVYSLRQGRWANFLRPARMEMAFRVDGALHNGIASVVGEQSTWTGSTTLKTLAVHVLKDAPETIVLLGTLEEAEAVRFKMADVKHEFRGLENIQFPVHVTAPEKQDKAPAAPGAK